MIFTFFEHHRPCWGSDLPQFTFQTFVLQLVDEAHDLEIMARHVVEVALVSCVMKHRFLWHSMSSDVRRLGRACVACQRSKVLCHTRAPLQDLPLPDHRFDVLSIDLVGLLPASEGCTYLLTVIDRFSRWAGARLRRQGDLRAGAIGSQKQCRQGST